MKIPFNTVNAVIAAAVLVSLPVSCKEARSEETPGWWGVATVRSYHYDRSDKHNEDNYGLGLEKHLSANWTATVGWYDNSYDTRSVYAGVTYTPIHMGYFHFGASGGLVDGYGKHPFSVYLFPIMVIQGKDYGVNIALVPSFHDPYTVIGLQIKRKF